MASWNESDGSSQQWGEYETYGAADEIPKFDNQSTPKIPPAFDGRGSWFAYEEAIDDWLDITTLDSEKQGPSLKNRLYGDAAIYKPLLDRDLLNDPQNGVAYFKSAMRPHFVKGNQSVFLWRFYQFLRFYRGQMVMLRWIGRLCVVKKRLTDAWMDLLPQYTTQSREFVLDYAAVLRANPQADELEAFDQWVVRERRRHADSFPINDNLFALMVTVQADLSEQQREKLSAHMSLRGIMLQAYTFEQIRECLIELFCAPRSSIENPSYRVSGQGRTFAVLEYGEIEGSMGYWAECEETGEEGFLHEFEDCFWTYDEEGCFWISRPAPFR